MTHTRRDFIETTGFLGLTTAGGRRSLTRTRADIDAGHVGHVTHGVKPTIRLLACA